LTPYHFAHLILLFTGKNSNILRTGVHFSIMCGGAEDQAFAEASRTAAQ
jgi:hypothetical protein